MTILTVIEGWGLPSLCVAELTPSNASEVLGRVLAEAVQTQRVALRAAAALEHPMLDSEDKLPGLEGVGSAEVRGCRHSLGGGNARRLAGFDVTMEERRWRSRKAARGLVPLT